MPALLFLTVQVKVEFIVAMILDPLGEECLRRQAHGAMLPNPFHGGELWAGQYVSFDPLFPPSSILKTSDYGKTWQPYGESDGKLNWMLRFTPDNHSIILASEKGLFKSVFSSD
jgi:hypothetical protein